MLFFELQTGLSFRSLSNSFLSMKTNYWHIRARKLKTDYRCIVQKKFSILTLEMYD